MKNFKKVILTVTAIALAGAGFQISASEDICKFDNTVKVYAEDEIVSSGTCGENITWNLNGEGTLTLSGTGETYSYYDAGSMLAVSPFTYVTGIKNVVIEDGITGLGDGLFALCKSIETIEIPDSVQSMGIEVFKQCNSLKNIKIPNGITWINSGLFRSCYSLESIVIPDSVTAISYYAFEGCTSLKSVKMSKNIETIFLHSFYDCASLTEIYIPSSTTTMGSDLFTCYTPRENNFKIYGYAGSSAELYAKENGYDFIDVFENVAVSGDMDSDEEITSADALDTLNLTVNSNARSAVYTEEAGYAKGDVDFDGKITSADALMILQYVVK